MFNAAVKNMEEEYETCIEPFYDDSNFAGYLSKDKLKESGGYDPDELYYMEIKLFSLSGAKAILSKEALNEAAERFREDFYIIVDSISDVQVIPCSAVYSPDALSVLSEAKGIAIDETVSFFHGIFRYYIAERKIRLISRTK